MTSKDGTKVGYRQMGSGHGIILLHGGVNASQHLMKLGTLLSNEFAVYIPDRRGRGMSGPVGEDYSIEKEDEDLDALLKKTGAHYVFGTADGALFALHAAISNPAIYKVAAYEPLVFAGQPELDQFRITIQHLDKNIAEGKVAKATVDLTKDSVNFIKPIPDLVLVPLVKLILWMNVKTVKGDDVSYQELIPTLDDELHLVEKTEGTIEDYKNVSARVLLLEGSKTHSLLKESLDALNEVLPHSNLVELKGLNHDSAQDYGKPEPIARELKSFFL
ncbi:MULTISPECIES: alpha/beta fold hydrolase [Methanobacterium]|uniref:alpha/beta fold hydrolase n=1 Tax=Methanobacterium TaxID=2160 RepID=UPI001B8054AD|nr:MULTISPECIES: alpha/beta hydrolase [Methanobacterium]